MTITEQATPLRTDTEPGEVRELRPMGRAIWRGALCRCPNCGKGKLYPVFLEQADQCPACGERLGQYFPQGLG